MAIKRDYEWLGPKPPGKQQPKSDPMPVEVPKNIPDEPISLTYKFSGTSNGRPVETIILKDITGIKKGHIVVVAIDSATKEQLAARTVPSLTEEK